MKRTVYEAPLTERFQVELEGVFCASADVQNQTQNGVINNHDVNTSFDNNEFADMTWDS